MQAEAAGKAPLCRRFVRIFVMLLGRKRPRCALRFDSAIHGPRSGYPAAYLPAHFPGGDGGVPGLGRIRRSHPLSADRTRLQRQPWLERPHPRRPGDRRVVHLPAGDPAVPRDTLGQFVDRRADREGFARPSAARADGGDAQRRRGRAGFVDHHHARDSRIQSPPGSTRAASSAAIWSGSWSSSGCSARSGACSRRCTRSPALSIA